MGRFDLSIWILILSNLIPIFGAIVWGWDAGMLLVLYWLESVIIGVLNIPKIVMCQGGGAVRGFIGGKIYLAIFFTVHYGAFCFGHAVFLKDMLNTANPFELFTQGGPLIWTAGSFFVSHLISMFINFYGKQEYLERDPGTQMFMPYSRVMIMHFVVIIGGALIMAFGQPLFALILLVILKIFVDMVAHNKSHKNESAA